MEKFIPPLPEIGLILFQNKKIIGYTAGHYMHGKSFFIDTFVVDIDFRNLKIGSILMLKFIEHLNTLNIVNIIANVEKTNISVINYYKSLGVKLTEIYELSGSSIIISDNLKKRIKE